MMAPSMSTRSTGGNVRHVRTWRRNANHPVRRSLVIRASSGDASSASPSLAPSDTYNALASLPVIRASDQQSVTLTSEWNDEDRAVVVFGRSFG